MVSELGLQTGRVQRERGGGRLAKSEEGQWKVRVEWITQCTEWQESRTSKSDVLPVDSGEASPRGR